jgi:hypothetical protein
MARKTYKQKYKSKRKDYRTGGRVKAARGFAGEPMEPTERKKPIIKKPIQPAPKKPVQVGGPAKSNATRRGAVSTPVTSQQPPIPVDIGGSPTLPSPILPGVKIDPTLPSKGRPQPPMSVGGVGGGVDLDEQFGAVGGTTEPETPTQPTPEPASPEIMRETTPPDTTFTTTNEEGEQITLPNMADWEKQWLKDNPKPPKGGGAVGQKRRVEWENKFNAAKEQHQADLDNATVTFPVTTTAQQQAAFNQARRERIRETGLQIEAASTGQVPEGAIIPEAEKVRGDIRQKTTVMQDVEGYVDPTARVTTAEAVAPEAVSTVDKVREGVLPSSFDAAGYDAFVSEQTADVQAALGTLSDESIAKVNEIRELSGPAVAAQISENIANAAKAEDVNGVLSAGAFVPEVTGANVQVSATPDAERQEREAITGEAASGEAAQIIGQVGYEAAKQRAVKGTAAKGAAATMVAQTADIPQDIAAAIVEDPATVRPCNCYSSSRY